MRFEGLLAWQEARSLIKMIFEMTKENSIEKDYRLNKVGKLITGLLQSTQKRLEDRR